MTRISDASVDAVKAAVDMVALVSERTQLRRSGANYMGRCPFHEERTPSCSAMPARGTYHCCGCGGGSDGITFGL